MSEEEIPHRVRCDSPKQDRESKTVVLGSKDKQRLKALEILADNMFDENVYKMDVYLAALRAGLGDDELFLEEMKRIGYGYFD